MRGMSVVRTYSALLHRTLRRGWRITRWPLLVLAILVVGLLDINAFDDKLTPQAQALLKTPDNPYSDEENLYVLLAGIDAPAGESMLAQGQKNLDGFSADLAKVRYSEDLPLDSGRTPDKGRFRAETDWNWSATEISVWDFSLSNASNIEALAKRYRRMVAEAEPWPRAVFLMK